MKGFVTSLCLSFILLSATQAADGIEFVKYNGSNQGATPQAQGAEPKTETSPASQFKADAINCVFVLKKADVDAKNILVEAKGVFGELSVALKAPVSKDNSKTVENGDNKKVGENKTGEAQPENKTPEAQNNTTATANTQTKSLRILADTPTDNKDKPAATQENKTDDKKGNPAQDPKNAEKQKINVALVCNYPDEPTKPAKTLEKSHVCTEGKVSIKYKKPKEKIENAIATQQNLDKDSSATYTAIKEFPYSADNKVEYDEKTCTLNVSSVNILGVVAGLLLVFANLY